MFPYNLSRNFLRNQLFSCSLRTFGFICLLLHTLYLSYQYTHRQTHIRTHLDISIPSHPATDTHMPRQTQACTCTNISIHTLTWWHTSAHIQNSMQKYTTHTYNHTHSPILLATHTHTHTHTLTHMPTKIITYTHTKLHSYAKPHSYSSSSHWCLLLLTDVAQLHKKVFIHFLFQKPDLSKPSLSLRNALMKVLSNFDFYCPYA